MKFIDANGIVYVSTIKNDDGSYWCRDSKTGFYGVVYYDPDEKSWFAGIIPVVPVGEDKVTIENEDGFWSSLS